MAHQRDQNHEKQGCIQLIRCIPPTDEERKNPQYVPQLEINQQAQQIISDRFEAPISIIVYAGNMGVGKSKLATVTVAALEKEPHGTDLLWFRSGAGTNGVTQGVWMWCEPLRHPDQDEQTKGSILVLDCEGMDNLDENTAANLYFFCMIISTAFVVVLRPARIDRFQCDRLYIALRRFEFMKSFHVLPNVWLLPLDLPKFLHIDPDTGDDIEISKEEWLHKIFSVNDERNNLSSAHNQRLKEQYEYITRMLPQIDTINIDYLPGSLMKNDQLLDVYTLLQKEESEEYFKSINTAIRALLTSGGKRLFEGNAENLFMQPAELADFMGELIKVINRDKLPNPNKLIEQYLTNRFTAIIEKESWTRFKCDLLQRENGVICEAQKHLEEAQMEEILRMDEKMRQHHTDLVRIHYDAMIRRARHEVTRHDISLSSEFEDEEQRLHALFSLPISIQERLNIIETEMKSYQEPVLFIAQTRRIIIESCSHGIDEIKRLLDKTYQKLHEKNDEDHHRNRENETPMIDETYRNESVPCAEANPHFFENTIDENSINISIDPTLEHVYKANENNDDIPKLFIVLPDPAYEWNDGNPWKNKYLLHVICECSSDQIHFSTYPGYSIPNPCAFCKNYQKYLNEYMVPVAKHILQRQNYENCDNILCEDYQKGLEKMERVLNVLIEENCGEVNTAKLLTYMTLSNQRVFPDLYRFVNNDDSVRWLCNKHYPKEQLNLIRQLYENGIEFDKQLGLLYVNSRKITDLIRCLNNGLRYYAVSLVDVRFPFDLSQVLIDTLWQRPPKKIYINSSWPLDYNTSDRLNHVEYQSRSFKDEINVTLLIEWLHSIKCLISLRLAKLIMSEEEMKHLLIALKNSPILRKVEFGRRNFEFSKTIVAELSMLLCTSRTLTHVDLSWSHLDDECMAIVSSGLCKRTQYILKDLCLDFNKVTDKSSSILCEIIKTCLLIRLSLAHNKLSLNGIQSIIEALSVNETILQFNIATYTCNNEENNRSEAKVGRVIANMLDTNRTLIDLNISAIRLNEQDIRLIAQSLKTNRTLASIQLGDNNFGDSHLEQLTNALRMNTSLIHISLCAITCTSAGIDYLSKYLSEDCTLRELTMSECRMTDACTILFGSVLSTNRTLSRLNLSNNHEMIGDEGAQALATMLRTNKTLTYLNIRNNCISNDGAQAIAESLLKNWTLTELDISDNNRINEAGFELFAATLLGNKTLLFLTTGYTMPDKAKQMLQTSRENLIVYKQ